MTQIVQQGGAIANAESQRAIAEVQAAIMMARANPRNISDSTKNIVDQCNRPSLAAGAVYQYSKGGSDINGPSIRLAEVIAQCWGNIQYGWRELSNNGQSCEIEAFAWDVQTNTKRNIVFTVKQERYTRKGTTRLTDPREIYENNANNASRRIRACILGIIPGDIVEMAVDECENTLRTKTDISAEAIEKMIVAFGKIGVSKEMIEGRIQRNLKAIAPAQIVSLRKIYASLTDGMSNPRDWFEEPNKLETSKSTAEQVRKQLTAETPKQELATNTEKADEQEKPKCRKCGEAVELDSSGICFDCSMDG